MRIGTERLDRLRRIELEGPKRQVVPVAAEVRHRSIAKIPPAIPLRSRKIDLVERPGGCGAKPEVPIEIARWFVRFGGPLGDIDDVFVLRGILLALPAPRSRDPNVGLGHWAN